MNIPEETAALAEEKLGRDYENLTIVCAARHFLLPFWGMHHIMPGICNLHASVYFKTACCRRIDRCVAIKRK